MIDFAWNLESQVAAIYRVSGYVHGISEIESQRLDSFFGLEKEIKLLCAKTQIITKNNKFIMFIAQNI